jgi:hypothetical protein
MIDDAVWHSVLHVTDMYYSVFQQVVTTPVCIHEVDAPSLLLPFFFSTSPARIQH